jgi:hypothetical protein
MMCSNTYINNFTIARGLGFLFLDTILYAVLAWYIDAVLPSKLRCVSFGGCYYMLSTGPLLNMI